MTSRESTPQISVVVPARNAAGTILRALRSVAVQEMADVETIVVDDCSDDRTAAVVKEAALPGVRLIQLQANRGVSGARNVGLAAARGRFIAFLDADDEWLPGKLAMQRRIIERDPGVTLVSCNCLLREPDGREFVQHTRVRAMEGPEAWKHLLVENFLPTPTVLCRRDDLQAVGAFTEGVSFGEDLEVWLNLALRGSVRVVPHVLVKVYLQYSGLSNTQQRAEYLHVLPLIQRYLDEVGGRISAKERRRIVGSRNFNIGYGTYMSGHPRDAQRLFLTSLVARWRVLKSAIFFVDCAVGGPLMRWRMR